MNSEWDGRVRLEVGGYDYSTVFETLEPSSYFKRMKGEQAAWCVARNGRLFEYVLDHLRSPEVDCYLPEEVNDLILLKTEAVVYGLPGLQASIDRRLMALEPNRPEVNERTFCVQEETAVNDEFEELGRIESHDRYWQCPRAIRVHKQPELCGKECKRMFCMGKDGWQLIPTTRIVLARR